MLLRNLACAALLFTAALGAQEAHFEPHVTELRLADPGVIEALRATDRPGLPKHLTDSERRYLRLPDLSTLPRIPPDAARLRTFAEYERNQAIIMRWESGQHNAELAEMIVPITTGDSLAKVMLVVGNSAQQSHATDTLTAVGADLSRVEFVIAPNDSVWIRDYGPRFSSAGWVRVIVDHDYNRPRPNDDQVPSAFALHLDEALYDLPLSHGGGNFHLFASGEAFMSELILDENPGYTEQQVIDLYADYQGVDLTILPALPNSFDATQHLDMWFLPVDHDTVIVGDYDDPPPGAQAPPAAVIDAIAETVDVMAGRDYAVLRTPGWRAGNTHYTYTNSVIVNSLVLICAFDGYPTQNAQALAVYEQAFPARTVVQVDCSSIIHFAGALHCIVMHKPYSEQYLDRPRPPIGGRRI